MDSNAHLEEREKKKKETLVFMKTQVQKGRTEDVLC